MTAEELYRKEFGNADSIPKESVIRLLKHFAKALKIEREQALHMHDVVCSCYMCGKTIERPEEQFDMYGEIVCQDCWDYNMYQALQDGGGM